VRSKTNEVSLLKGTTEAKRRKCKNSANQEQPEVPILASWESIGERAGASLSKKKIVND